MSGNQAVRIMALEARIAELERQHQELLEGLKLMAQAAGIPAAPEPARERPSYLRAVK